MKNVNAFYICNRKKCSPCNPECTHTRDRNYAVNVEGKYRRHVQTGDMWQTALPDSSEGLIHVPWSQLKED